MAGSFLYFICEKKESRRVDEYMVRIGLSNNVKETREQLESARATDLRTYAAFGSERAEDMEKLARDKFAAGHVNRGWYRIKKAELNDFVDTLEKMPGVKYFPESKARLPKRPRKVGAKPEEDVEEPEPVEEKPEPRRREEKPKEERPKETKPREERPREEKPREEKREEKVREERLREEKGREERPKKERTGRREEKKKEDYHDRTLDWD